MAGAFGGLHNGRTMPVLPTKLPNTGTTIFTVMSALAASPSRWDIRIATPHTPCLAG